MPVLPMAKRLHTYHQKLVSQNSACKRGYKEHMQQLLKYIQLAQFLTVTKSFNKSIKRLYVLKKRLKGQSKNWVPEQ